MTVARQRFGKHIPEFIQLTVGSLLLRSRSVGARFVATDKNNNRVIHKLLEMVIYIRFAWKLIQSTRVHSSFVTVEEKTLVVQ
jgi:hypothetical protein